MIQIPEISSLKIQPQCSVFGQCGGCLFQDIPYSEELMIKQNKIEKLFTERFNLPENCVDPIVASPQPYHYRNRLDLKLNRTKAGEILFGFSPEGRKRVVPIDACPIARQEISDVLPTLRDWGKKTLPLKYQQANLVVRSGEEQKVFWGGIGRRSLQMLQENYFWTTIEGRKIFYSLETFFQSNLFILPLLFEKIFALDLWEKRPVLFDLYGGVGLFSVGLYDRCEKVYLIEESSGSLKLAKFNQNFHKLNRLKIIPGKVETEFPTLLAGLENQATPVLALIDPPRCGLSSESVKILNQTKELHQLLYLSCQPEALVRDLNLMQDNWTIDRVLPFDFFPRTKHLETLVLLKPKNHLSEG